MPVDLVYYASKGNLDKIKQCVQSGVCVDAHGGNGETALFHASRNGFRRCVEYLLKRGADPNCCTELGFTPVNAACFGDHVTSLALLVQHGGLINRLVPGGRETSLASAARHRSKRCLQFINMVLKDALTKHGENLLELNLTGRKAHSLRKHKPLCVNPGLSARVPCIEPEELKIPQGESHQETGPAWLLRSAIWRGTPVSVKLVQNADENADERKYDKHILKEIDILSQLRHPRLAILMAANVGPDKEHIFLALEPFELGSLHYVLYETQLKMNLAERVGILQDVAEGMIFLHNLKLHHCFLNSYSVLLSERFRGKIGNLEHAQESGSARAPINGCEMQTRWMAPEQLLAEPASNATDVYSFGATMWECLARTVPWDWIEKNSIQHVMCDLGQSLPVLQTWPNYVQTVVWKCLDKAGLRPNFCSLYELMHCNKNRGWDISSESLDNIFTNWLKEHKYTRHSQWKSIAIKKQTMTQKRKDVIDEIIEEKYVPYRRHSSVGEKTLDDALMKVLRISDSHYQKKQEKKDTTKYGKVIAAQMSVVRRLRAHAEPYNRHRWAKELTLARALEGDMERLQKLLDMKKSGKEKKRKPLLTKSEVRQLRMKPDKIERFESKLRKVDKKIWARHLDKLGDTFQMDARRKSIIDSQINLLKSRSNLVRIHEEAFDSEESESNKSDFVEIKLYSSSSENIDVDQPECTRSEVLESGNKNVKLIFTSEKRAAYLTKSTMAASNISDSDSHLRMLLPRSKSLSDISKAKVALSEQLPWKQMSQQEGVVAATPSLEKSNLSEEALIGNAPEISSSASKVRKAHYVTQVASGMHPRTSVSYNGRGRTTLQEPATAHASSSAPDVLTPVEVAPSFKASKKASENGETLKLLEDLSSWLDENMTDDSGEEDSEDPGFKREGRFESDENTSRSVLSENNSVARPIIPNNDAALGYRPTMRPSNWVNQTTMSEHTSEGPIQRGQWTSKNKEPKYIFQSVTRERNITDKRQPRKSLSLVNFKNEDIKVYPEEASRDFQQRTKRPKDFSFEKTLPVDTNGRHVSVELKVAVRRKGPSQHVRNKSL